TSDESITRTSDESITRTSDESIIKTSDESITRASDESITKTSDENIAIQLKETSENLVNAQSDEIVINSQNDETGMSDSVIFQESIIGTSDENIAIQLKEEIVIDSQNDETGMSNNSVTFQESITGTNDEIIAIQLNETSGNLINAQSDEIVIDSQNDKSGMSNSVTFQESIIKTSDESIIKTSDESIIKTSDESIIKTSDENIAIQLKEPSGNFINAQSNEIVIDSQIDEIDIDSQFDEIDTDSQNDEIDTDSQNDEIGVDSQNDDSDIDSLNDESDLDSQNDGDDSYVSLHTDKNTQNDQFNQESSSKTFIPNLNFKRFFTKKKRKDKSSYFEKNDDDDNNFAGTSNNFIDDTLTELPRNAIPTKQNSQNFQTIPPDLITENAVTTRFHIMMPKKGLKKKSMVFVIGNIRELGDERYGIVSLKKHLKNPIHWYSDPISIPLRSLEGRSFFYRYFIYNGTKGGLTKKLFGQLSTKASSNENTIPDLQYDKKNWDHDYKRREFSFRENHFDVWCNSDNSEYHLRFKDIE
ncbi:23869_t:CDS:1, partial [Racocetra persica]